MNRDRNRKRSKSNKRKSSHSNDRVLDETQLLKMLDERAHNKQKVLISKDELKNLKDCKHMLKNLQEEYEHEKKLWFSEQNNLKASKHLLQQENQELRLRLQEAENKLYFYDNDESHTVTDQQANLNKIKESLSNLESLVAFRSNTGNKLLLRIHRLLAKHAKLLLDQPLSLGTKNKLTTGIKKMSQAATAIENILVSPKTTPQELEQPEDQATLYKQALEKMKSQTLALREKLKELENGDGLKKIIEDQETKIQSLVQEKEILRSHIFQLQNSLKDQCEIIGNLKGVMKSKRSSRSATPDLSPEKDENTYKSYIDHDEKDLQAEIANLDSEIQHLQNSLKRALVNH